jgi:hypothetical protein
MTDSRDPRISALIVEIAESSPEAPKFEDLQVLAARPAGDGPVRPLDAAPTTTLRAWTVGIAAAVVTLVLLGGVIWLVPFGTEAPPATENSTPTTVEATPTTEAAITAETAPETITTVATVPTVPPGEGPMLSFVQTEAPTGGDLGGGEWFKGDLYVLSSGEERALYRTTDGFTWELVPGLPSATNVRHSMLQTDGNMLVNVVMPSDGNRGIRSDGFIEVNTSTNGTDWISSNIKLPVPIGTNMAGEFQLGEGFFYSDNFTVGPNGIVVAATIDLAFEGEGFANGLVDADEGIHVEIVDLDLDRGVMIVQLLDEENDMEQIGDLREIDLNGAGFSGAFSNLLDALAADPDWEPLVPGFIAQLSGEATTGFASVSLGHAWFSPDGVAWQQVESTGPLDGGEFRAIQATSDGFIATASSTYNPDGLPPSLQHLASEFDSSVVWESADGTTWTEATSLTSGHAFDTSALFEWQGDLVEHVGVGMIRSTSDGSQVWTLADPAQRILSELPTSGVHLEFTKFGLIGTPSYGWWGPDATELLFSVDGTNRNRWEPSEFSMGGGRESGKHQGDAWITGVGDNFVVLQHRQWDESSSNSLDSLWVGTLP